MEPMTERQRDKERTRAAILDAAERHILSLGPAALRLEAVAREAGVSKSVIFYHFGSKKRLLAELKMRQARGYAEGLAKTLDAADDFDGGLEAAFRGYFQFLRDNPKAQRTLSWGYINRAPANPVLVELRQRAIARAEKAQADGVLRADIDPRVLIIAGFSLVEHWFEIRHMFDDDGLPLQDDYYLDRLVDILQYGSLPPTPNPPAKGG